MDSAMARMMPAEAVTPRAHLARWRPARFAALLGAAAVSVASIAASPVPRAEPSLPGLALRGQPEAARGVSASVTAARGATLEATGGDGTVYRLVIPPKSLPHDLRITLTPLAGMSGVPGQTLHLGADIAPAGTRLERAALLVVRPRVPLPKTAWLLEHQGAALRLSAWPGFPAHGPEVAAGARGLWLSHFSGGSVVAGTAATDAAVRATLPRISPNGPLTRQELEVRRNGLAQELDHLVGTDRITAESQLELVDRMLQERAAKDLMDAVDAVEARAAARGAEAVPLAEGGLPGDFEEVRARVRDVLIAEKLSQLLGTVSRTDGVGILLTYYGREIAQCDFHRTPVAHMVDAAQLMALLGREDISASAVRCACRAADPPIFCPVALAIENRLGVWDLRGESCGLGSPFTVQGSTTGGHLTWQFIPEVPWRGEFAVSGSYTANGMTLPVSGGGGWTLSGPLHDGWLVLRGQWCVGDQCGPFKGDRIRLVKRAEACRS